jgi:hypothetical protein
MNGPIYLPADVPRKLPFFQKKPNKSTKWNPNT